MKDQIFFILNKQTKQLIAWSSKPKLLSNYIKSTNKVEFDIQCLSRKKFSKKFLNDPEKELIKVNGQVIVREHQEYMDAVVDNDYYRLADTIEFIKTLGERFDLSEKEQKRLSKANRVLMDLFNDFDEYYRKDAMNLSPQLIEELKEQDNHLKDIMHY